MQINKELAHYFNSEIIFVTNLNKNPLLLEDRIKKCRLVSVDANLHIAALGEIKPGDTVIDLAALDNGYVDVIRECEDPEDAEFLNLTNGAYQKQIAKPFEIGAVLIEGSVNHDHVLINGQDYTIEIMHPSGLETILESGGECYILMDEEQDCREPKKFLGRVLIISKDQFKEEQ